MIYHFHYSDALNTCLCYFFFHKRVIYIYFKSLIFSFSRVMLMDAQQNFYFLTKLRENNIND